MTMATMIRNKLMLAVVLILATASASLVLHAHASRSLSPSAIKTGLVVGEGEGKPYTYINFKLFGPNGWPIAQQGFGSDFFKPGKRVQLEMDGNGWLDPCRIIIRSYDGWKVGKAWYIQQVSVTSDIRGDTRTFVVNRWIGPEEFDSFLEIDNCDYGGHSLISSPTINQLHAGGGNDIPTTTVSRDMALEVQTGLVFGEGERQPDTFITYRLFGEDGLPVSERSFGSGFLQPGEVAQLEMEGDGWSDPCRIIIKSDDGWKAGKAWYIRWVRVTSDVRGEERKRTFVVNRWIGPEEFDSYLEIDNCNYGAVAAAA